MANKETEKQLLKDAFNAGMAYCIGSHTDFSQTHLDFDQWYAEKLANFQKSG